MIDPEKVPVKMIVKAEVEATPEVVGKILTSYVARLPKDKFPAKEKDLVYLQATTLQAINAVPGMPVYVLAVSDETSVAAIVYCTQQGECGMATVNASQVVPL